MHQADIPTLSYATRSVAKPPSNALRLFAIGAAILAGAVGLLCLALYAASYVEFFAMAGFFWLGIGGTITLASFCCGAIYLATGFARKFPPPSSPRRGIVAIALPLLTVLIAIGCVAAGTALMERQAHRIILINEGQTRIDRLVFASPNFDYTVESLGPGERTYIQMPERPSEKLHVYVHIGTKFVPYVVTESMSTNSSLGPRYVKFDGLTGYKNQERTEPK